MDHKLDNIDRKIIEMLRRISSSSLRGRTVMSLPSIITWPEVGRSRRFMQRTRVLLPAPDRPMMPNISPSLMVRLMSRRASTVPEAEENVLLRSLISIIEPLPFNKKPDLENSLCFPSPVLITFLSGGYETRRVTFLRAHHHAHAEHAHHTHHHAVGGELTHMTRVSFFL